MCGAPFWGIAAFLACAYSAHSAYVQLREQDFYFQHGLWNVITCGIWVVLLAGVASETRCWRERILLALLLANFALGFVLAVWIGAPSSILRAGREISLALWVLAAFASLGTIRTLPPAISNQKE
jgi:hypothetical protein